MDLTNILNTKDGAAAAAASAPSSMSFTHEFEKNTHLAPARDQDPRGPHSEIGSEVEGSQPSSGSPSVSDQSISFGVGAPTLQPVSVAYSSALQQHQLQQQQQIQQHHQQQLQHQHQQQIQQQQQQQQQQQHQQHQQHPHQQLQQQQQIQQQQQQLQQQQQHHQQQIRGPGRPPTGDPSTKAFPCSSCGKGFARRSDLARHERIHSGIRPHVCDYPGCDKQFIQRSALTVHARVHTGEKPHMCETCGKPFSDSSSLARHRRIHSGKRPYKCPYADCQKTFTRRTTLTRHQNHHTGTISEAAAATAAVLAARPSLPRPGRNPGSPTLIGHDSGTSSAHSTPSPGQRTASMSPANDLPSPFSRNDYLFRPGGITSHPLALLTGDMQTLTPRATPTTTPTMPSGGIINRPPTSNPTFLAPMNTSSLPPILEPSAKGDFQRSGSPLISGSLSGSPHMSSAPSPLSRGSPHMSSMGYHSPSFPTSAADEGFYFQQPQQSTGFQTNSSSPEPGVNYSENSLQKQRSSSEFQNSYDSSIRKVSSTV